MTGSLRTGRNSTALFWIAVAALAVGHTILALNSLLVRPFWEDEAFNLTVPRNLLDGLGYTSDGALSGSVLTPFDPRISTGPAVLLPVAAVLATGLDLVMSARIVPLAYWLLLLAGLAVIGRRIGGRWAMLVAVAVPLAFTADGSFSPIQGPADLLGEIPAAALLVWALIMLPRRTWLAGLLVGLAVQAKFIALLALPAFAVALWLLGSGEQRRIVGFLKRSWLPLICVGVPTLLFEVWVLIALGYEGWRQHLRSMRDFVLSGGQADAGTTVAQKLLTLAESWSVPTAASVIAAVIALALVGFGLRYADRLVLAYAASALVGAAAFIGWWATASKLPLWVRHPAPGIYAFFPIIAAVAIWAVLRIPRGRIAAVSGATAMVAVITAGAVLHLVSCFALPPWRTLDAQRAAVAPVAEWVASHDVDWLAAEPWGAAVAPIVMSGAHVGLFDSAYMNGVPRLTGQECQTETLVEGTFRVCAAPVP